MKKMAGLAMLCLLMPVFPLPSAPNPVQVPSVRIPDHPGTYVPVPGAPETRKI
jgi:hypothetical protein